MLHNTILAVNVLTQQVGNLTEVTAELVEVTKAVHRERAAQIRMEIEELDPENHPKVNNFKMWHLAERLKALEMPMRTPEQMAALDQMPYLPRSSPTPTPMPAPPSSSASSPSSSRLNGAFR